MEQLPNGYTLTIPEGTFPLSTDSMVLSHFVRLPKQARILDLGSGCGTLGVLLCASDPGCSVTGIELEQYAHTAALENIGRNGLTGRMESICADLRSLTSLLTPGCMDVCVSNPPYFSGGPESKRTPTARRENCCSPKELFAAAAWALKYGGDFYLVHRPERLGELITRGAEVGLEVKRLCLLRHKEGSGISLIFLAFRKGGKPGLTLEEACLFHENGEPTPFYRDVYHI